MINIKNSIIWPVSTLSIKFYFRHLNYFNHLFSYLFIFYASICIFNLMQVSYFFDFDFILVWFHSSQMHYGSSIKGRGVCQMRTLLLIFACRMSKFADTGGGGSKNGQTLRTSLMDGPLAFLYMISTWSYIHDHVGR